MATGWTETIAPDEEERFARHAETLGRLQRDAARGGRLLRALHAKGNAGYAATFEVLLVPADYQHGLFAAPATHPAYVRFSNGSGRVQPDKAPDIRGVAIKVLDVDGRKVIPGLEAARTQDFLLIQTPAAAFRGPDEFVEFVRIASGPKLALLPRLITSFGPLRPFSLIRALIRSLATSKTSFAEQRFFTALPIQFGPHAAKLDLRCTTPRTRAFNAKKATFGADLASRIRDGGLTYELGAQLYVDDKRTPIEDSSIRWDEAIAPFIPVARLTIAPHDTDTPAAKRIADYVEQLSFDPWHALVAHRPLGAMMRARNHAYRVSTTARGALDELRVERIT